MLPSNDVNRLVEIMAALRAPETGCPWDIEQTFRSITPYTIEEVYEVVDAIERHDMDNLREELGDLLLQVVYHSQMAAEEKEFDFKDVVQAITEKMIRRHPHVFGDEEARNAGMAKGAWDRIKAQEKAEKAARKNARGLTDKLEQVSILDDVPAAMPPLLEALKLQQKAAKVGFDWNNPKMVIAKLREELDELEVEIQNNDSDAMESELGDVLFTVVNMARHMDIDSGSALRRTNGKFRKRFASIEKKLEEKGEKPEATNLERLDQLWNEAKSDT